MTHRHPKAANVVIVGTNERAYALSRAIERSGQPEMSVLGFVNTWGDRQRCGNGHHVLGDLEAVDEVLCQHPVDGVIFAVPRRMIDQIEPAVRLCETMGIRYWIAADLFSHTIGRVAVDQISDWPLIRYDPTPHGAIALRVKRAMDFLLASLALVALSPLMFLVALAVWFTSPGGVIFVQTRVGLNGRLFPLFKFRTMVTGAEGRRRDLEARNEMQGPVFKITADPRVTLVGGYLRRYYLDELPQLFNVLWGHMSLVGPRPPVASEVAAYSHRERRRLSVRPGLTCIWQVSHGERRRSSFDEWVAMDLEYIDRWSLGLDLRLLVKTIPAVLRGTGR